MTSMNSNIDHLFKLLLIGNSGVGKSCLLGKFADGVFNENYTCTIGVDFKIKVIDLEKEDSQETEKIKLQIWDTAGSERFRTITSSYYRGCHGMLIVYDTTNLESFKAIDYWYQTVENHKINPVIALIGTKADLKEECQVSIEEAEEKARQLKCDHCLTSSKEDTNVENAFLNHVKAIRKNPNYLMNKVPSASAVMAQMNVNLNSYPDNSSWFCC